MTVSNRAVVSRMVSLSAANVCYLGLELTPEPYGNLTGRNWILPAAIKFEALRRRKGCFHPPQSYRYVEREEFVKLMA